MQNFGNAPGYCNTIQGSFAPSLQVSSPRNYGIDLTQLFDVDESHQQFTITLPEGKDLAQNLQDLRIANDFIDYTLESKQTGKQLIVKRHFVLKKRMVPAEQTAVFKTIFQQIAEADEQQLALITK